MIDDGPRPPRTSRDLRAMRGSTVATLAAVVLTGTLVQLVIGEAPAASPRSLALAALTVASAVAALAAVPLLLRAPRASLARHPLALAPVVLAAATWLLALVPPFAGWGWAFTLAIAGGMLACLLPGWWAAATIVATYAAIGIGGALAAGAVARSADVGELADAAAGYAVMGMLAVFVLMPLSAVWVLRVVLRLEEARRVAAELAVARERLRFATDLHDIQGHHLQVIALKSELAERLLPDDRAAAAAELGQIRSIAQTALDDTRAVVNDYRMVTVAVESRNAAAVLRSAGIRCESRIDAPGLPAEADALFAVAIREAATNILRHSAATAATIGLAPDGEGGHALVVTNDGAGPLRLGGTGLAGLAERIASRGGTLETARRDGSFVLTVRIPHPAPAPAPRGGSVS